MNNVITTRSPAGFWKRYVAYSIDIVLLYVVVEVLSRMFYSPQDAGDMDQLRAIMATVRNQQMLSQDQTALLAHAITALSGMLAISSLVYVVVGGAYFALCESSAWQATLGKCLLRIKVVAADGTRIDFVRALARFFAASLSWLTLNIGHALAALSPEHRALHDYIAGTRVENADPAHPRMSFWGWLIVGAQALVFLLGIAGFVMAVAVALNGLDVS